MIIKSDLFIKLISWFMKPAAITLYPFIIVSPKRMKPKDWFVLINHEKIHLDQQRELWVLGFYVLYIYYSIRRGYKNNPFEMEAHTHTSRQSVVQV